MGVIVIEIALDDLQVSDLKLLSACQSATLHGLMDQLLVMCEARGV